MGETEHEPDKWINSFCRMLDRNNMGWTFWLYKKMGNATSRMGIKDPQNWDKIIAYQNADRSSFDLIRKNRPNQDTIKAAMAEFIVNLQWKNTVINDGYIKALGMKP